MGQPGVTQLAPRPPAIPAGAPGSAGVAAAPAGAAAAGLGLAGIIKLILIGLAVLLGALFGAAVVGAVLVFTGEPKPCSDRAVPVSAAASQRLRAEWDVFKQAAAAGQASVTFDESEVTSRGVEYIDEKGAPISGLQVYFCPQGYAEASGTISVPGPDIKVVARGTLDLTGKDPRIDIQEVRAGNLPAFAATRLVNTVLDRSDVKTLKLSVRLTAVGISDSRVRLDGVR